MNDKIRKYIVPNIPYLFICWIFLKLGTAYRMAPGADFAHMGGMVSTARLSIICRQTIKNFWNEMASGSASGRAALEKIQERLSKASCPHTR